MNELVPLSDVYYRKQYWNEHPQICELINRRVSGDSNVDWILHFKKFAGRKFKRALILNCGNGWVERDLYLIHDYFESCVGIDVMENFIEEARAKAPSKDFHYIRHDINKGQIPEGPYDLIVNHAASHHIARLDKVFSDISTNLTDDGLFVNFDFVGPHRNQYPYEI